MWAMRPISGFVQYINQSAGDFRPEYTNVILSAFRNLICEIHVKSFYAMFELTYRRTKDLLKIVNSDIIIATLSTTD